MISGKRILFALLATTGAIVIFYSCKSAKPATTATASPQVPQARMLLLAKTPGFQQDAIADSTASIVEKSRNALPMVSIQTLDNSTFFFDKPTTFRYAVAVQINEDGLIDRDNLRVTMKYIPRVTNDVPLTGYPPAEDYSYGRNLMAASDCKTCHQEMGSSTIPSFAQIAENYWGDKKAIGFLANKIITGGNGVWGEQVMSAHPQLSKEDATEIVKYVLSISSHRPEMEIPQEGAEVLNEHIGAGEEGRYVFTALYRKKVGAATPLTGKEIVVLRHAKVEVERADVLEDMQKGSTALNGINHQSYFVLKNIDLKDVHQLTFCYSSKDNDAIIEVHTDAVDGPLISATPYKATGAWERYEEVKSTVANPGGKHDLYFVFVKKDGPNKNLASLDWLRFEGGNEVEFVEKRLPVKSKLARAGLTKVRTVIAGNARRKGKLSTAGNSLGSALIAKSDCHTCHKMNQKMVGPAYTNIAQRYKARPSVTNRLVDKILGGGAGNWGTVPMTPHPQLSRKAVSEMVKYILSLTN